MLGIHPSKTIANSGLRWNVGGHRATNAPQSHTLKSRLYCASQQYPSAAKKTRKENEMENTEYEIEIVMGVETEIVDGQLVSKVKTEHVEASELNKMQRWQTFTKHFTKAHSIWAELVAFEIIDVDRYEIRMTNTECSIKISNPKVKL